MLGTGSSYGAATPVPNPVDGLRVFGLLSRIGPAALACSYTGIGLIVLCWVLIGRLAAPGRPGGFRAANSATPWPCGRCRCS